MKKATIITGPERSGKSFLAQNVILAFENPVQISAKDYRMKHPFLFQGAEKNTDVILFHDVSRSNWDMLLGMIYSSELRIVKKGQAAFYIPTPKIIAVLDFPLNIETWPEAGNGIDARIEIVDCSREDRIFDFKKVRISNLTTHY